MRYAPLVAILRSLQAEAPPGFRPLRLEPGHGANASDKIIFVGEDRTSRWSPYINPYTGAVLWRGADQALVTPWLLHLHMHLQAGPWGYVITGLAAIALTLLSITGVWITHDRLAALLRFASGKATPQSATVGSLIVSVTFEAQGAFTRR